MQENDTFSQKICIFQIFFVSLHRISKYDQCVVRIYRKSCFDVEVTMGEATIEHPFSIHWEKAETSWRIGIFLQNIAQIFAHVKKKLYLCNKFAKR